ncbi:nitroreductase family protein [Romboutsia ilealis]|uniref:nitroreductase family protein n=1 Tax=Romboutsia ilealis TaxID=1115758 RepID=UPI00257321E7|nr:nitroreductase family protein [Romboutsia ilealis]
MELYDAIFYRKSIRKYSNKRVKDSLLEEVKNVCSQITYLNKELNIKAHVIDRGHLVHILMGKNCKVKAPHYIIVTSNKGNDYLQNIGYAMEEVVLKLTTLGLATCWLECNIKREDILEFVELPDLNEEQNDTIVESEEKEEELEKAKLEQPYSIIAFGYPEENERLFRTNKNIDRKRMNHICKKLDKNLEKIIEPLRWAPSMKNSQPWILYNNLNMIHLYEEKQKKNLKDTNKISMGIALRHFDIACKKFGLEVEYSKMDVKKRLAKEYYITATLK